MLKKYKYLLSITIVLVLNLLIIAPSLIIFYDIDMAEIIFLPNSSSVLDNGFKQLTNDAGLDYERDFNESFDVVYPNSYDRVGYEEVIRNTFDRGANTIIVNGNETQGQAMLANLDRFPDKTFTFLDDGNRQYAPYDSVIGIKFNSNEAAFIEGIISSIYLVGNYIDEPDNWKAGAWGGMQLINVVQWLAGYEQAFNWFNYRVLGTDLLGNKLEDDAFTKGDSLMLSPGNRVQLINKKAKALDYSKTPPTSTNSDWFVNSFAIGDGQSVATNMVSGNAKILFPIAGPQTADALNVARSHKNVQVLGVDVDANMAYSDYSDIILSSGIKNVRLSSYYAFWYAQKHYLDSITASTTSFDYTNPEMFIKPIAEGGWNEAPKTPTDDELQNNVNPYGNQFLGTLENGGVGAAGIDPDNADDQNETILDAWKAFVAFAIDTSVNSNAHPELSSQAALQPTWEGFDAFWNLAYNENTKATTVGAGLIAPGGIENLSDYFAMKSDGKLLDPEYVHESNWNCEWIPDWDNKTTSLF